MRLRLIGLPIAALLLVGGATAVLAQSGGAATQGGGTTTASEASPGASGEPAGGGPATEPAGQLRVEGPGYQILEDVLAGLVTDGTITQAQAEAIEQRVEARKAELREQAEALREQAQALREQIRGFLEDDVISAEELAQLPADSPLRNLDQFLADGQITADELRQIRGLGFGPGRGHRHFGPPPAGETAPNTEGDTNADAGSTRSGSSTG